MNASTTATTAPQKRGTPASLKSATPDTTHANRKVVGMTDHDALLAACDRLIAAEQERTPGPYTTADGDTVLGGVGEVAFTTDHPADLAGIARWSPTVTVAALQGWRDVLVEHEPRIAGSRLWCDDCIRRAPCTPYDRAAAMITMLDGAK